MLAPGRRRMTSLSRTCVPFNRYSFCPSRWTTRSMTTSLKSRSSRRLELSNTTLTAPRFARESPGLPPHMRSSPFLERIDFIDCSPRTKRNASATFDFPEPLGPTTATIGLSNTSSVFLPNDLNPTSSMDLRYIDIYCIRRTPAHRNTYGTSSKNALWLLRLPLGRIVRLLPNAFQRVCGTDYIVSGIAAFFICLRALLDPSSRFSPRSCRQSIKNLFSRDVHVIGGIRDFPRISL